MRKKSINRARNPINKATGTGTTIGYREIVYNVGPGSDLSGKIIRDARLSDANLDGSLFVDSIMPRCDFSRSKLNNCDFSGANLRDSDFSRAELKNSEFIDAELANTDFFSADLSGADLRGANLYGSSFLMSDLTGAKITPDQLPQIEYAYFHEAFKLSWSPEDHDIYLREYLRSIEEDLMELRNKVIVTTDEDLGERVANPLKGYGGWGRVPRDPYQYDPAQYAPYHFNPYDNYLEVPGYEYGFGRVTNPGYGLYDASYEEGDRPPKIVGSSDPYVLDAALSNHHGPTSTVEAEYGDAVVSGSWATLAHHGSRSHNLCPCLEENRQPPPDLLIGVSHFDLDTLGGTMALLGIKPNAPDFWRVAARIDTEGPHKLPLMGATRDTVDCLNAFWAWSEDNRVNLPRASAQGPAPLVDLTDLFLKASSFITALLAGHRADAVSAGRAWVARNEALERETLVSEYGNGAVLLRSSDRFVNHLYGPTAVAVVGYNTAKGSISLSFSDEGLRRGLSANDILQEVYGPLAGGHVGIGGTPRGETYTLDDAAAFAQIVADKLLRRTPNPGYGHHRGYGRRR